MDLLGETRTPPPPLSAVGRSAPAEATSVERPDVRGRLGPTTNGKNHGGGPPTPGMDDQDAPDDEDLARVRAALHGEAVRREEERP